MIPVVASFGMDLVTKVIENLATSFVLFLVLVVIFLRGKLLEWMYQHVQQRLRMGSVLRPETAVGHSRINERLTRLLNDFQAQRVCVFQFHNGEVFMLSNHMWKASCSHEILRPGAQPARDRNQHNYISSIADLVAPMLDPDIVVPGVQLRPSCCGMAAVCPHAQKGARRVLRVAVQDMAYSHIKMVAEQHGVQYIYTINLLDPKSKAVLGFIMVQFDTPLDEHLADVEEHLCRACVEAEAVEYFLTTDGLTPKLSWRERLDRMRMRWFGRP